MAVETPICDFGWKAPDFRLPDLVIPHEVAAAQIGRGCVNRPFGNFWHLTGLIFLLTQAQM